MTSPVHNDSDIEFLNYMVEMLDANVAAAKKAISSGKHPDVIVAAHEVLSNNSMQLGKMGQLKNTIGDTAIYGPRFSISYDEQRGEPRIEWKPANGEVYRSMPFELGASSDGLTLEGYAAVFNTPTRIDSWEGTFDEQIVPGAFGQSLRDRAPVLMFEHGKHPLIGTMPLGVITRATEDSKGLHIEARLSDNWLIQPVRDAVRDRAVKGMSFRFHVPDGGDSWQTRDGDVRLRTINQIAVSELGPVVFPAYEPTTATIRSLAERLPDLTGRPDARSAGGGESGTEIKVPSPTDQQRLDEGALRARGIVLNVH